MNLTMEQFAELAELENIIQRGKDTFLEVGMALMRIKDKELYKRDYDTWEAYCRGKWGFTQRYANQLITSANVVSEMGTTVPVPSERAARELGKLPEEQRKEVLEETAKSGPVTAKAVQDTAQRIYPKEPTEDAPKKPMMAMPSLKDIKFATDNVGRKLPPNVMDLWNRGGEAREDVRLLKSLLSKCNRAEANEDQLYAEVTFKRVTALLENIIAEFELAIPYAVCPACQGFKQTQTGCELCKARGILSKFRYDTCVPKEFKKAN